MRRCSIAAFILMTIPMMAAGPQPVPLPSMNAEKWRADVDVFARQIPKRHANAFHAMTRERFDQAVADLKARTDKSNDDEMIVGLMEIAASVGDGHTRVFFPAGFHRLPVNMGQFEGDFRVTRASADAGAALGARVIRIDQVPISEVVERLRRVISQDESEWFVRGAIPSMIVVTEILHGLGIVTDPMKVRLTVLDDEQAEKQIEVAAVPANANSSQWPTAQTALPLMTSLEPQAALAFTYLEAAKTVYVNFRRYDDLRSRSKELWQLVDSRPVEKIAIDLRGNGGGDYTVGRKYLVSELKARPKIKAYVLIGNRTFSAAMNNAIDFRNDAHAILVGQPIGEKANSYQENDEIVLPNSKLVVSYSTRFYEFLSGEASPIVKPEHEIAPTWADFVAGRDPALEWVLAQK
jgi:hypothetical protein